MNDLENIDILNGDNRTYTISLLAVETRHVISSMYLDCENKFQEGVAKYEELKKTVMEVRNLETSSNE